MSSICAGCKGKIKDRFYLRCSKCTETFDLLCINMTKEYFEGLGEEKKNLWVCPSCVCSLPKGDNSSTPVRAYTTGTQNNTYLKDDICNVNTSRGGMKHANKAKTAALSSPTPQLDITGQLLDLRKYFDSKLESIKKDILNDFSDKLNVFEESVQRINRQHDLLDKRMESLVLTLNNIKTEHNSNSEVITNLSQEFSALQTKMTTIENDNKLLRSKLSDLDAVQLNLNDVEQRARINNLEIFGIAEKKTEALAPMICKIASVVGVKLAEEDIDYATRLPSRVNIKGLPRTVIVKFKSIHLRDSLLSAVRKRRGLVSTDIGIPGDGKPIYINEHLTSTNKALLKATKIKCKELGFQNIWTRNAKIYVRQHHKAPAIRIFKLEQLDSLKK